MDGSKGNDKFPDDFFLDLIFKECENPAEIPGSFENKTGFWESISKLCSEKGSIKKDYHNKKVREEIEELNRAKALSKLHSFKEEGGEEFKIAQDPVFLISSPMQPETETKIDIEGKSSGLKSKGKKGEKERREVEVERFSEKEEAKEKEETEEKKVDKRVREEEDDTIESIERIERMESGEEEKIVDKIRKEHDLKSEGESSCTDTDNDSEEDEEEDEAQSNDFDMYLQNLEDNA
jgi:hypothetical protein